MSKVVNATRRLNTEIENSIKAIIEPLKRGEQISQEALSNLVVSKASFDETSDALFKSASENFGVNSKVIPIEQIKKAYDQILTTLPKREVLQDTQLSGILDNAISRAQARGNLGVPQGAPGFLSKQAVLPFTRISIQEAQTLRKIINNLQYDDRLALAAKGGAYKNLKAAVEKSFEEAEDTLALIVNNIDPVDLGVTKGALRSLSDAEGQRIGEMLRKGGFEFGKDLPPLRPGFPGDFGAQTLRTTVGDLANINKGLTDLRRAREFYAKGINRFDDAVVEKIYAESKKGSLRLDPKRYLDQLVKSDQPSVLRRFLFAVRGSPQFKDFDAGQRFLDKQSINIGGRSLSIKEAEDLLPQFADGKQKTNLIKRIEAAKRKASELSGRVGTEQSDAMRQSLARA
jgi:hypothetical protein